MLIDPVSRHTLTGQDFERILPTLESIKLQISLGLQPILMRHTSCIKNLSTINQSDISSNMADASLMGCVNGS